MQLLTDLLWHYFLTITAWKYQHTAQEGLRSSCKNNIAYLDAVLHLPVQFLLTLGDILLPTPQPTTTASMKLTVLCRCTSATCTAVFVSKDWLPSCNPGWNFFNLINSLTRRCLKHLSKHGITQGKRQYYCVSLQMKISTLMGFS